MEWKKEKMKYKIGDHAKIAKTITETDVYSFAGICGDFNPLHVNEIEAKNTIFGKRIAHGILGVSLISTVLGMYLPGPGTIYASQNIQFTKPIYFGDTITADVEIVELLQNGRCRLKTQVINQDNEVVITGEAIVILPKQ